MISTDSQKTPYLQRLSSIVKHTLSSHYDYSSYRAQRAHVIPAFNYPSSPTTMENKRPAHNLLSNILPSTSTSSSSLSSNRSGPQSTKSFICDATAFSTLDNYLQNHTGSPFDNEVEDYLCKTTSSLALSSPGAYFYDI